MIMYITTLTLYFLVFIPENRTIENKLVMKFNSFGEFEQFAQKTNDGELLGKIKIVRTFHHNLPINIHKILARTVRDLNTAGHWGEDLMGVEQVVGIYL